MPVLTESKRPSSSNALRQALCLAGLLLATTVVPAARAAQADSSAPAKPPVLNSAMDQGMFYQVLVGEIQARAGDYGTAYQVYLDAARRHRNPELFKRTVNIALQANAGEEALSAAKAWRQAYPHSKEAAEYTVQILLALGRSTDLVEPLKLILQLSPTADQPRLIAALPATLARLPDRKAVAQVIDEATLPWRKRQPGLAEAWVASGEGWLSAKDNAKAMEAAHRAQALQPNNLNLGLLAMNLMENNPAAEDIVRRQLTQKDVPILLRLAYAQKLASLRRMNEAAHQLDALLAAKPDHAGAWLTLAAVRLELHEPDQAEAALKHFLALKAMTPAQSTQLSASMEADSNETRAFTLMAEVEEQRGNWAKALDWLQRVDHGNESLLIQSKRAKFMAKQGKLEEGRALIRAVPETEPRDALAKLQVEAQLLRDLNEWPAAYEVLAQANQRFPDEPDLLYEQAMLAEQMKQYEEMEKLLRRAIQLKPDNAHPYNALGYSLADRKVRLDEARTLIRKALALRPGDPFITDSLGWLEFRSGHTDQALKLLRQAYQSQPDPEIAAHLGEVVWARGDRDEAIRIWRKAQARDAQNAALLETLKRLQVQL